jgi:hypothetical protein
MSGLEYDNITYITLEPCTR